MAEEIQSSQQAKARVFDIDQELVVLQKEGKAKVQDLDVKRAELIAPYNIKIQTLLDERKLLLELIYPTDKPSKT